MPDAGDGADDDDLAKAREFYGQNLGVFDVAEIGSGLLSLRAVNGYAVLIYLKPGHQPATHTILNFPVDDLEAAVDELRRAGVEFEQYDQSPIKTNEKGIATPDPKQTGSRTPPATSCRSSRDRSCATPGLSRTG